ncbi:two component regulator with propeller domain [Chitinophaga niastensis]|uniref:Two component regulator with propeller domain n=1 Tax=Chitinophaga niastensis TaxID=536980 RepID=A0A2P8HJV5_CHINA|nr:two-component regulator propeller domain-containing protein [Chitinophaga niastensis]PSL46485.1 two component regulator with propeller domain [Chitinophaga niastensis]
MPFIRYIMLWGLVFFCTVTTALAQGLMIRNYNVKDGLANATVYAAVQDKDGFIWFATPTGVSKFDGKRFRNYAKKDGLTDNDVFKLAADTKGRVWFFTLNGKPSFYDKSVIHSEANDSSLIFNSRSHYMQYAFEGKAGYIWFLNTNNRIVQYTGKKTIYDKLGASGTDLFFLIRNDSIFHPLEASFHVDGLRDPNNPSQKIFPVCPYPLGDPELLTRINDNAVVIVRNALYSYTAKDAICFLNGAEWGIHDDISHICIDNDNLWVGTQRALYYLKGFFKGERKVIKLLDNHYITSLLKDRDGNIWITTFGDGVYNIPYKNFYFSYLDNTNGLYSHSIFSICKDKKSEMLLIGQNAGILNTIDRNNNIKQFTLDTTTGHNSVLTILPSNDNSVLIGTDNGLYRFNTTTQKSLLLKAVKMLKDVDISPAGKIRIAAKNQVIALDDYTIGDLDMLVTSVACINDSAYYVGTNTGLYYCTDGQKQLKPAGADTLRKLSIKDLKWVDGYLWIGTSDQGIYVMHNDSIVKHLSSANNLASDICQQLYYDGRGRLYVATNRGVSVIDVIAQSITRNITSNDGLMSDDIRGVFNDDGILYIATSNGLCYFNGDHIPVDTIPPVIYLSNIRYGDSTFLPGHDFVHLYKRKASFEAEFGTIVFDLPELVQYQYNFSGDTTNGWITTMSNIIPFPDLQPGSYKLMVRARKYKSEWSAALSMDVNILPRWYQEWWARGILLLAGVLLILVVLRYIVRRIKQAEKRKTEYNRRIAELEAKALTNQMNPHFIFNSLNSVQHLILEKEEKQALNFLADFATLMRQMLNNSRKSYISLEEEIAFLTRYLELEKIRFAHSFTYHFIMEDALKDYTIYIPPMIIQPIVENAIKHGLAPKNISGYMEIRLEMVDDLLYCSVDDDGIGWDKSNSIKNSRLIKHESTALSVIKERLQIIKSFNGSVGKLEIIDKFKSGFGNKEGTLVEILIPIVKML